MKFSQSDPGNFPVIVLVYKGESVMNYASFDNKFGGIYGVDLLPKEGVA